MCKRVHDALAAILFAAVPLLAAEDPDVVLVMPSCPAPLEVAPSVASSVVNGSPCRESAASPSACLALVEVDHPGVVAAVQSAPALTAEGLPCDRNVRLLASIPARKGAEPVRRFTLGTAKAAKQEAPSFRFEEVNDTSLGLWEGEAPVFVYNHGMITAEHVPAADPRRTRACYIHPVYGLSGEILTADFPADHYHHHGIFWTWPHVKVDDQEYDLWGDRGIKQRFVGWLCREVGPVAAVLGVENGWFVGKKKVMIERVWLRAYQSAGGARSLDLEFTWIPVEKPITLWGAGGKSYGGLTVRFAPPSRNDPNTRITVPDGPTTADLPDTPLAWADYTSQFGDAPTRSGAAVFVGPDHPDYPPTWLTRHYGPLCVGWPGVEPKTFPAGVPIRLAYRVWVHEGPAEPPLLHQAYAAYTSAFGVQRSKPKSPPQPFGRNPK